MIRAGIVSGGLHSTAPTFLLARMRRRRSSRFGWRAAAATLCGVLSLGLVLQGAWPASDARAQVWGAGRVAATIEDEVFEVFTYHPPGCAAPSLLFVFHGNGRTAASYRDAARPLADRACFVILAPLFDEDRFPNWSYHRGGIVDDDEVRAEQDWTVDLVDDMVAWARSYEGRPDAPVFLFGHSAGGQFLSRVAAYGPPIDVERIVVANPSTYVAPDLDEDAPYGFDLLEDAEARLRAYLAAPVTVFLGAEDTGDEDLTDNAPARRQGENRLDRGRTVFEAARGFARDRDWAFRWRLVEAPGIGHQGGEMMRSDEMLDALGLTAGAG